MNKRTLALTILAAAAWSGAALAAGQHIDGKNYKVDVNAAACKVGAECTATVKLDTTGGYHLNKEYPYKVKVTEVEGVKFAKPEFGKASGDFVEASEHSGTITLKFTPSKVGKVEVAGAFKFAVCSDKDCATATEAIKLEVDVKKAK